MLDGPHSSTLNVTAVTFSPALNDSGSSSSKPSYIRTSPSDPHVIKYLHQNKQFLCQTVCQNKQNDGKLLQPDFNTKEIGPKELKAKGPNEIQNTKNKQNEKQMKNKNTKFWFKEKI